MIRPSQVAFYSKKAEKNNYQFRSWLKFHVNPEDLDRHFLKLHNELFSNYDCSRCRNCCKKYYGSIPKTDLRKDASYLGLTVDEFREKYLDTTEEPGENGYRTKNKPCDFLDQDGNCILGECKPTACTEYPHTNKPDRMESLLSFLDAVSVCPVAYEICERLKSHYNFR